MPPPTPKAKLDDQIVTLQGKLHQLKLRQHNLAQRKQAIVAQRERKLETRRKMLVGAVVLTKVARGEIDDAQFREWLDESLTRAADRALFSLPAREL
jgi:conjugal transfer/entry exclusion protein